MHVCNFKGQTGNHCYRYWLHWSKRITAGDLQCHPLKHTWLISRLLSPLYDWSNFPTSFCLFDQCSFHRDYRHMHFLIYLFFRKATPKPTHRNKHPSHSCKYTERLQDQDAVRCFTFCVGGESDSKSSLVCFPIKKKSAWRKQCCGVLRPAVQQCYISQAVRKDASCFCNASNFVKMLSMEK